MAQEYENASNAAEHLDNFVGAINNVVGIIETGRELWDAGGVLDAGNVLPILHSQKMLLYLHLALVLLVVMIVMQQH
ncbi:MAG: hypothetical protein IPL04_14895 [Chitinophagaceae bacterium]|nr:hypothetical protein [Chitinophagaceae bacterium]